MDWVNYLSHNHQGIVSYSTDAIMSLAEQLEADSLMPWPSRTSKGHCGATELGLVRCLEHRAVDVVQIIPLQVD